MTRRRSSRPLAGTVLLGAFLSGLAGCGSTHGTAAAPAAAEPSAPAARSVAAGLPSPYPYSPASPGAPGRPPPVQPGAVPSTSPTPSFADAVAVACGGYPGLAPVLGVLRGQKVISRSVTVRAIQGPLCAGAWQYTVLKVSGREPLQVVTEGTPDYLALIAAGTDVCTSMVRTEAPGGIVSLARC